jgi:hypothetical protein
MQFRLAQASGQGIVQIYRVMEVRQIYEDRKVLEIGENKVMRREPLILLIRDVLDIGG